MKSLAARISRAETKSTMMKSALQNLPAASELLNDFLKFTQYFYELRTGREFALSTPICRQSHYLTIIKALENSYAGNDPRLLIHCPPRYGKTELMIHFVAWSLAKYPDSNYIYISYTIGLASKQTSVIKQIIMMPQYRQLFGVKLSQDTRSKAKFETTEGGTVTAAGSGGEITGWGAGIANVNRWGGCIIIDDIHKPKTVTSELVRSNEVDWYTVTAQSRINSPHTPIIGIGQILHEDDLFSQLHRGLTGETWTKLSLAALDKAGNALDPSKHTKETLARMEAKMPYVFYSQYQQEPLPPGGGLFKRDWFPILTEMPKIISTFITVDTAETSKTWNDATVFSFFGLYKIQQAGVDTDIYGIHWLDCVETWVEPSDLNSEFLAFYASCMRFHIKPRLAAIEKKSTGVTLVSQLQTLRGLHSHAIERTKAGGSKSDRFIRCQSFIASGQVSFSAAAPHLTLCLDHMSKITADESQRRDDIADTCADAIQLALIDKFIINMSIDKLVLDIPGNHQQISNSKRINW